MAQSQTNFFLKQFFPRLFNKVQETLPIEINRKRIYILPTRYGMLLTSFLCLMLIGGLNYNNNLVLLLTFALFSLVLVSAINTQQNLSGLIINHLIIHNTYALTPALLTLHIQNNKQISNLFIQADVKTNNTLATIKPHQNNLVSLKIDTHQRGKLLINRIKLSTDYPLGLFRAWAWLDKPIHCIVYPALEKQSPPLPYNTINQLQNNHPQISSTQGQEEFDHLIEHQNNHSPGRIAWKISANKETLYSKNFTSTNSTEYVFTLDATRLAKLESQLSRLSSWITLAYKHGANFQLILPNYRSDMQNNKEHVTACLTKLALFNQVNEYHTP